MKVLLPLLPPCEEELLSGCILAKLSGCSGIHSNLKTAGLDVALFSAVARADSEADLAQRPRYLKIATYYRPSLAPHCVAMSRCICVYHLWLTSSVPWDPDDTRPVHSILLGCHSGLIGSPIRFQGYLCRL